MSFVLKWPSMVGYGPDVSGINGSLDFRVAHGDSWVTANGQKRVQPATMDAVQCKWGKRGLVLFQVGFWPILSGLESC